MLFQKSAVNHEYCVELLSSLCARIPNLSVIKIFLKDTLLFSNTRNRKTLDACIICITVWNVRHMCKTTWNR